jgi:crossover junction endonuclease MUS81
MDFDYEKEGLNPLIERFLLELKMAANRKSSKMEFVFGQALKSLRAHGAAVFTLSELRKVKFFGEKTCKTLQDKLDSFCAQHSISLGCTSEAKTPLMAPDEAEVVNSIGSVSDKGDEVKDDSDPMEGNKVTRKKASRQYVPRYRSVGFGLLIALIRDEIDGGDGFLTKTDLMQKAAAHCDDSVTMSTKFGPAVKTLLSKELIEQERQRFSCYRLSGNGRQLARQLFRATVGEQQYECLMKANEANSDDENTHAEEDEGRTAVTRVQLPVGQFEIILIVDTREKLSGFGGEQRHTKLLSDLEAQQVKCESRTLAAGDFTWIAKPNQSHLPELMLDFVIERKQMQDLASSIKDNRWSEQKYRLKRCGLRRPLYLIEGFNRNDPFFAAMNQAIADAQIIDGFSVKHTKDHTETVNFLALHTRFLKRTYESRSLTCYSKQDRQQLMDEQTVIPLECCISYNEYAMQSQKITNFTAHEMFIKHLLQINGMTLEKAKAITDEYETLPRMIDAYNQLTSCKAKEVMIAGITFGNQHRTIGNLLSRQLYVYYGGGDLP